MDEYIDKKDLIEFIRNTRQRLPHESKDLFTRDNMLLNFEQIVSQMPAVDVAKVRHGKWEVVFDGNAKLYENMFECSVCKTTHIGHPNVGRYCPNCGAKMDGTPKERGGENEII